MKPYALSIAGFDPSAGAGILADIKTFQANHVYGFGVCSAITFQNDKEFENVKWMEVENIIKQIDVLFNRFKINWVKIGLIENVVVLKKTVEYLLMRNPDLKIIWDPILKASSGFVFHEKIDGDELINVCRNIFLITPNTEEIVILFPRECRDETMSRLSLIPKISNEEKACRYLSQYCAVLLKGGHKKKITTLPSPFLRRGAGGEVDPVDTLFQYDRRDNFYSKRIDSDKHGTGCVLSAAILANLAMGDGLVDACRKAKQYINKFLESNSTLLGEHIYKDEIHI